MGAVANRLRLVAIFIACFSAFGSTGATVVRFDFTAEIFVISRNFGGIPVNVGDSISGFFQYDTAAATQSSPLLITNWQDYQFANDATIGLTVGGQNFTKNLTLVTVVDGYHPLPSYFLDRIFVASNGYQSNVDFIQLWIDGADYGVPSSLLSSADLPVLAPDLSLADLGASPVTLNTSDLIFTAYLQTIAARSVPEPGTLAVLTLGLAGLAATQRKRKPA